MKISNPWDPYSQPLIQSSRICLNTVQVSFLFVKRGQLTSNDLEGVMKMFRTDRIKERV